VIERDQNVEVKLEVKTRINDRGIETVVRNTKATYASNVVANVQVRY
jgi:hypothetical protein